MLSKSDYENYLKQMKELEIRMMETYRDTAAKIEDKEIKEIFLTLTASEKKHSKLVDKIAEIVCPDRNL